MGSVNASVDLKRDNDVAIITIENPPVNALKHAVRAGLIDALEQIREPAVTAVVLTGSGRAFSAGADISEFGKPLQPPGLHEVIAAIEATPKPVVAAIAGTALGGGLELALACHYRVGTRGARVGLPEIKLGILPGAGGTQRLPRLIGPEKGLEAIVSGDMISADQALSQGVLDAVLDGDRVPGAVEFARKAVGKPLTLVRDREDKIAAARKNPASYEEAAARIVGRARGRRAQSACVESVRNAFQLPFEDGLAREQALFRELVVSDESRAQRHVFFAEREAARVPDMPATVNARPFPRAAVIGAGTMGGGIAMSFANAGIPVTIIETGADLLQKGLGVMQKNYEATAARGGIPADAPAKRMGLITGVIGLENVKDADLVI